MNQEIEIGAVVLAGILIFVGLMKYVTEYMKKSEARRAELFEKYEQTIEENAKLKAAMIVGSDRLRSMSAERDEYRQGYRKYRKLYAKVSVVLPPTPEKKPTIDTDTTQA